MSSNVRQGHIKRQMSGNIEEELEGSSIGFEPNKSITLVMKNDGRGVA